MKLSSPCLTVLLLALSLSAGAAGPFDEQVRRHREGLRDESADVRRRAAESLGYLRAAEAAPDLAATLSDTNAEVRREAALSLAWCGGRAQLTHLLAALDDRDWTVRQSAHVALGNLTGMEFAFDALAPADRRREQAAAWRTFLQQAPATGAPPEIARLIDDVLKTESDLAAGRPVAVSSTYKGPAAVVTGDEPERFWQTKNVAFPQHCTIDLGAVTNVGCVVVEQYGPGFCMTNCAIALGDDGETFRDVWTQRGRTDPLLTARFDPVSARFVRIVSRGSENPTYPTTFFHVRVFAQAPTAAGVEARVHAIERALRGLGTFGGPDASGNIQGALMILQRVPVDTERKRLAWLAGLRGLGRIGDELAVTTLANVFQDPYWARYAADALGECGSDAEAVTLAVAYPKFARSVEGKDPAVVPPDDRPGFESIDRAYETPYAIAAALSRLPLRDEAARAAVRKIAPLLIANLPGDFDGAMLYEPEAHQQIVADLLERTGARAAIRDVAFEAIGEGGGAATSLEPAEHADLLKLARAGPGGTSTAASWLPALCRMGERTDALIRLLDHSNGWVRINAAKTLLFTETRAAAGELAWRLAAAKTEAEHGYFGGFHFYEARHQGQDDYNAPSPNWREAFVQALGGLGGPEHSPLFAKLLTDDRNVLEVQMAAAKALDRIDRVDALKQAAADHPFHSIRLFAREALWRRGLAWSAPASPPPLPRVAVEATPQPGAVPAAIVFIQGENRMPNTFQIDIWRQNYSTTDTGPTYRPGRNLFVLRRGASETNVTALTHFADGYVADCEVSWNGTRVLFARRGGDADPWWHVYEIGADGSGLRQLTRGPYHDVQPAYLPDGRIVFSSSRTGLRDEYHGYPATGLTVMNADGSDLHCIGFNLGRDNEPVILPDGRIAFSRLDLFYSRLKTEMTLQAVLPDGTKNVTLYGPERREFWRQVTAKSGEKWWAEAPPRHRVVRVTQPQPYDRERLLCASTGGPVLVGPGRLNEAFVPRREDLAVTGMVPLGNDRILCAATKRSFKPEGVDLGLYVLDAKTGVFEPLYNDPAQAEFEPRPLEARRPPQVLATPPRSDAFTGRLLCSSARTSQDALTRERGVLVRIIEGQPVPSRHHTHTSSAGEAWKNHVGTHARILGTVPLAPDGSFHVEVPADRLVHCQVLDTDRNVVGNQLIWMYARPGETRSCIGCHEIPDSSPLLSQGFAASAKMEPLRCLPTGGEFSYRAKAWQKGTLRPETEERTRTVQAVNLLAR